jgi:hypothetical protein
MDMTVRTDKERARQNSATSMPRAWANLGLLLVFAVTAWGQSPAPKKGKLPPDLTEILSHMNAAAGNLRTISANLDYTKVTVLVDDKAVQSGQLYYRKGKGTDILIDFKKPEPKAIAFRKDRGEIYNPKINQIDEFISRKAEWSSSSCCWYNVRQNQERLQLVYQGRFTGDITVLEMTPRPGRSSPN